MFTNLREGHCGNGLCEKILSVSGNSRPPLPQHFAEGDSSTEVIEWIYLLLTADPERGADVLERARDPFPSHEDEFALRSVLQELIDDALVSDRPEVCVLLRIAAHRASVSGAAAVADLSSTLLDRVSASGDDVLVADIYSLAGDVAEARGDLAAAEAAFQEGLAIVRRLVEQDPTNTGWQRELAVAHSRVGGVAGARGDLAAAEAAFQEGLAIVRRLVEQDPTNTGWQRELAVAHNRVGGVAEARGDLAAAEAAFQEGLAINRRLVEQDPTNTGWQRELAVAHNRVGGVAEARGDLAAAEAAFQEGLAIVRRLVEQDPTNTGWQMTSPPRTRLSAESLRRAVISLPPTQRSRRAWPSSGGWSNKTPPTRAGK